MQKAKETASNVAASAKAGMEKTKATVQEKVERMTARDPVEKEMATERKEAKISQTEQEKQEVRLHNATARQAASAGTGGGGTYTASSGAGAHPTAGTGTYTHSTTGAQGHPTGTQQMSALPGHGTGQPVGQVVEGTTAAHPMGVGGTTGLNTHVPGKQGGGGHGTGGTY